MLSHLFLGMSLVGAEWVLYLLVLLSVISVALILERWRFYHSASKGLAEFRTRFRSAATHGKWDDAQAAAANRMKDSGAGRLPDLESEMALGLVNHALSSGSKKPSADVM